jgi:hypothetical protein
MLLAMRYSSSAGSDRVARVISGTITLHQDNLLKDFVDGCAVIKAFRVSFKYSLDCVPVHDPCYFLVMILQQLTSHLPST